MQVDVYFNLHQHRWSVRDRKTRRVIGHADHVYLKDARFHVSPAGNAKVRAEGRRNVHAWVSGELVLCAPIGTRGFTYNPYAHTTFVDREDGQPLLSSPAVFMDVTAGRRVCIYTREGE